MIAPITRPCRAWRIAHAEFSGLWGGRELRVMAELTGFKARGCAVCLMTSENSAIITQARASEIFVVPLRLTPLRFASNLWRTTQWLKRQKLEVVNTHGCQGSFLIGLSARLAQVPLILHTQHGEEDYRAPWINRLTWSRFSHQIICSSSHIAAQVQEMGNLAEDLITTIPTGVDSHRFSPEGPVAHWSGVLSGGPIIGMISPLTSTKGHSIFLKAAQILERSGFDARYLIVGSGPMRQLVEQQILTFGLQGRALMVGHREDIPEVLRSIHLLVIPSTRREGIPQIAIQALATKTAVIGSDIGGIAEVIHPGHTGRLFPLFDAEALAVMIREAIQNPAQTREMADNGRILVEKRHNLQLMLDRLNLLYERFIP